MDKNNPAPATTTTATTSSTIASYHALENFKSLMLKCAAASTPTQSLTSTQNAFIKQRIQEIFPSYSTPDHPPYAWMIENAIKQLNRIEGSNEDEISKFILQEYKGLPWAHWTLLKHHLRKLCECGNLVETHDGLFLIGTSSKPNSKPRPRFISKASPSQVLGHRSSPTSSSSDPGYESSSTSSFNLGYASSSGSSSSDSFSHYRRRRKRKQKGKWKRSRKLKDKARGININPKGKNVIVRCRGRGRGHGRGLGRGREMWAQIQNNVSMDNIDTKSQNLMVQNENIQRKSEFQRRENLDSINVQGQGEKNIMVIDVESSEQEYLVNNEWNELRKEIKKKQTNEPRQEEVRKRGRPRKGSTCVNRTRVPGRKRGRPRLTKENMMGREIEEYRGDVERCELDELIEEVYIELKETSETQNLMLTNEATDLILLEDEQLNHDSVAECQVEPITILIGLDPYKQETGKNMEQFSVTGIRDLIVVNNSEWVEVNEDMDEEQLHENKSDEAVVTEQMIVEEGQCSCAEQQNHDDGKTVNEEFEYCDELERETNDEQCLFAETRINPLDDQKLEGKGFEEQKGDETGLEVQKDGKTGLEEQKLEETGLEEQKEKETGVEEQKEEETILEKQIQEETGLEEQKEEEMGLEKKRHEGTGLEKQKEEETGLEKKRQEGTGFEEQKEEDMGLEAPKVKETGLEEQIVEETCLEEQKEEELGLEEQIEEETCFEEQKQQEETCLDEQKMEEMGLEEHNEEEMNFAEQKQQKETNLEEQKQEVTGLEEQKEEEMGLEEQEEKETGLEGQKQDELGLEEQNQERRGVEEQIQEETVLDEQKLEERAEHKQHMEVSEVSKSQTIISSPNTSSEVENQSTEKPHVRQLRPRPPKFQPIQTKNQFTPSVKNSSLETNHCRKLRPRLSKNKSTEVAPKAVADRSELRKKQEQVTRRSLRLQKG